MAKVKIIDRVAAIVRKLGVVTSADIMGELDIRQDLAACYLSRLAARGDIQDQGVRHAGAHGRPPRVYAAKPRALDLFCGMGGATRGLQRAGFHVTGVDIRRQRHYIGDAFVQADALAPPFDLATFDLVWASPPCQRFTALSHTNTAQGRELPPDLLNPILDFLRNHRPSKGPGPVWIVENVLGAGDHMVGAVKLHGAQFGLKLYRPRLFLSNVLFLAPPKAPMVQDPIGVYDERPRPQRKYRTRLDSNGKPSLIRIARTLKEGQDAMGIDWGNWEGLKESIPPAYAEWLGRQVRQVIRK